jgi:outer membrane receptor protein involved in Fe transport
VRSRSQAWASDDKVPTHVLDLYAYLSARVDNLADRRVAGSVIVNEANQRFFEPAAGRNGQLSVRWQHGL